MAKVKVNKVRYDENTIEAWLEDVFHHSIDLAEDDFFKGISIVCGNCELTLPFCPETWELIEDALTTAAKNDLWEDYR